MFSNNDRRHWLDGQRLLQRFHSSLPLRFIEAAIEEDGEAEIDGLTGTLSTGFSADELRFRNHDDHWSKLTGIEFQYEGNSSFLGKDSLVIKELSVDSGIIYADWDPDEQEIDFDPSFDKEITEINREFEDIGQDLDVEIKHAVNGIKELRVDLVSIANLQIINPASDLEITIDEIKFEDFQLKDGVLQSIGQLAVKSSQLELKTLSSVEFADMETSQRFEGILRSSADHRLHSDVPFSVDFGIDRDFRVSAKYELFDEQLRVTQLPKDTALQYNEFNPANFMKTKTGGVLPSKIHMQLEFEDSGSRGPVTIAENGSFELGQTSFAQLQIKNLDKRNVIVGEAKVDGHTIFSTVLIGGPFSHWEGIHLQSATLDSDSDVWAWTIFGNRYEDLTAEQQQTVAASIESHQSRTQRNTDAISNSTSDGNSEKSPEDACGWLRGFEPPTPGTTIQHWTMVLFQKNRGFQTSPIPV